MKSIKFILVVLFSSLLTSGLVFADVLHLKDGRTIEGKFMGTEDGLIKMDVQGITVTFPQADVARMDMGASSSPAAPAAAPAAQSAPVQSQPVVAGTVLNIELGTDLDAGKHSKGHKFKGRLNGALVDSAGKVVVKAGSEVYGVVVEAKKSGRVAGNSKLVIALQQVSVDGVLKPIKTNIINAGTDSTTGSSAKRTLGAAAIGGLADGSDGAKTGAKVGLGLSLLTGGNQVKIPSGTLLEFRLIEQFIP